MNSKLAHLGVVFLVLGAALLLTPSFGFETIASDRSANVDTADDENATIGFEATGESIDNRTDSAALFRLRNNADQQLTLSNLHQLSITNLAILDDGSGTLLPGGAASVAVECGDFGGTDTVTLTTTVESASGETLTISGASSMTAFLADCDVPSLVWDTDADWSTGAELNRTVSDDVGDRESDTVRLGYGTGASGLVGYWPLDEDSGSTAYDATINGNDGSHVNGPQIGRAGVLNSTAYEFEATNDEYVQVPNSTSLQTGDSVSVSAWVKIGEKQTDTTYTAIAQKSNQGYNLQLRDGEEPGFTIYDGAWQNVWSGATLTAGEWHHVAGTYDGDTARIYVDGTEANSLSGIGTLDTGTADVGIGTNLDEAGRQFDGSIEELRVYDHGLSASEVDDLYYTADNGTHTTDWRSTEGALKVEDLFLQNVSTTLAGTDATASVESDVDGDGTVDETSDPISLTEGTSEYAVSGLQNDTDRVRLHVEFATANVSRTPIVSRVELAEDLSNFSVAIDGTNEPVVEGEVLDVDVTVENVGGDPGTQTVELRDLAGDVVDDAEVSLNASESATLTLTWNTQSGDAGAGDVIVASDDDTAAEAVTVQEQANFSVAIDGTNEPVDEGTDLDVDVTVENTGDVQDTQTVELQEFGGSVVDTTDLTLDGGENQSIVLTWTTQDGDAGSGDVTVASANDSVTEQVTIQEVHYFSSCQDIQTDGTWILTDDVQHTSGSHCITLQTPEVRLKGQNHTITMDGTNDDAVYANRYDNPGDYEIRNLTVDGGARGVLIEFIDRALVQNVTIENAAKALKTYNEQARGDDGDVRIVDTVAYGNADYVIEVAGDSVTTLDAERFTIGDPAANGSTLSFDLYESGSGTQLQEVTNPASAPAGNESIGRYFQMPLAGDALENVTLHYEPGDVEHVDEDTLALWRDDGSWTRLDSTVDAANDTLSVGPDLASSTDFGAFAQPPPAFDVAIDGTNSPVDEGQALDVDVTVQNTESREDTQTVELRDFDGTVVDSTDVTLGAGATNSSITLTWTTSGGDAGTGNVTVATESDSDEQSVTIDDASQFDVSVDGTNEPVAEGEPLDVDVTVQNTGDVEDTQTVELRDFGGSVVDATEVTLGAGESNSSITLTWATTDGDAGTDNVTVASEDDSTTRQVTVDEDAWFDVSIDSTNAPIEEGQTLQVDATVANTGDRSGTQTVELRDFEGTVVDSTDVTLDSGETNGSVSLSWATQSGDGGSDNVTVASEDDTDSRAVTVEQPATFDVSIDGTNAPVEEGQDLDVDITVQNTGDQQGTQTVELANFSDVVVDAVDVSLGAGESNSSITLTWTTQEGDAGTGNVTVTSENDSATEQVTVETPGPVSVTNVAPNASSGEDTQYFEFELQDGWTGDHVIEINVSNADNSAEMSYDDSATLNVENGSEHVKSIEWVDYAANDLTGAEVTLESPTAGEYINVSTSDFTTTDSGGPWTVTFEHGDGTIDWLETDDFEIEG